jgi:hypothetical protein
MPNNSRARPILEESDFANVERMSGLRLAADQRQTINSALRNYQTKRAAFQVRPRVAALGRSIEKTKDLIDGIQNEHPYVWLYLTKPNTNELDSLLDQLQALRRRCQAYERKGRPPDIYLKELLTILEMVFKKSGGGSTAIPRVSGPRAGRFGPFVDFCYEILRHLDRPFRQQSQRALAAHWERCLAARRNDGSPRFAVKYYAHWRPGR